MEYLKQEVFDVSAAEAKETYNNNSATWVELFDISSDGDKDDKMTSEKIRAQVLRELVKRKLVVDSPIPEGLKAAVNELRKARDRLSSTDSAASACASGPAENKVLEAGSKEGSKDASSSPSPTDPAEVGKPLGPARVITPQHLRLSLVKSAPDKFKLGPSQHDILAVLRDGEGGVKKFFDALDSALNPTNTYGSYRSASSYGNASGGANPNTLFVKVTILNEPEVL